MVSTINVEVGDYYDHFKIAITPDGTRAYLVNQRSGTISVIDLDPGSTGFNQVVSTIEVRGDELSTEVTLCQLLFALMRFVSLPTFSRLRRPSGRLPASIWMQQPIWPVHA